jgi:RNA polymerase sigma-70 factor (ECF subfamily)
LDGMIVTCSRDRVGSRSAKDAGAAGEVQARGPAAGGAALADARLVQLAIAGRQDAFAQLFERYRERVYRIAYGWCFDSQTALDLVQDVFVKVYRSLGMFREEASFWTWLCRIAINRCLDFVRKKERTKEMPVEDPQEYVRAAGEPGADPVGELELRELKGALTGAIDALSPEARSAFILRFFDNLSYKEIAAALDCSIGTVMSRLFYARQKLRDLLGGYL